MKTSILTSTLALVASVIAVDVTEYLYVTVDGNGNTIGAVSSTFTPSTLLTVTRNSSANGTASSFSKASTSSVQSVVLITSSTNYNVPTPSSSSAVEPTSSAAPTTLAPSTVAEPTTTSSSSTSAAAATSASSNQGSSLGGDGSFQLAMLNAHNSKRASHNALPLTWDSQLAAYAQDYANKFQCGGSLVHSGGPYGENLAMGYSDAASAVEAWYSEGANYDYSSCSVFDHFTQVIWKSTTKLGCAYKDCDMKYIICSYDPAGNFVGQGPQNLSA